MVRYLWTTPIHLDTSSGSPENFEGGEILISDLFDMVVGGVTGVVAAAAGIRVMANEARTLAVIFRRVRGS